MDEDQFEHDEGEPYPESEFWPCVSMVVGVILAILGADLLLSGTVWLVRSRIASRGDPVLGSVVVLFVALLPVAPAWLLFRSGRRRLRDIKLRRAEALSEVSADRAS